MISQRDAATVRRSILIGGLPEDVAGEILVHSAVKTYDRGESVFLQGEPAHSVFVVLEGWIKLFRIAQSGAEAVIGVFAPGQSFGEAVAFRRARYPVNAEAVTETRLLGIDAPGLMTRMRANPEICTAILAATFHQLQELVGQVEQLKAQTGAQRVARFLLGLCHVETGTCTVTMPYDKVLIAGRLGMKPESLSRAFARLKPAGVRVTQNHAEIDDVERLRDFVEQDRADFWRKAP